MKILIADDSLHFRILLKKKLEKIKEIKEILESESFETTVSKLKEEKPDILILDIRLPDESGLHVLDYLYDLSKKPLVCVASDFALENIKKQAKEKGADHVFDKAREIDKIIKVLKEQVVKNLNNT